ncbi:helix-turn-helix domain-containing protein [Anaeromicropila populeti]|uniref:Helix-turn-helix domain-containing protein n=1 Tax=Anaeromicropila populeti TaxID=37658 RepID=A0A1I6JG26_9FIRM|nr:helix-turn-helix domain-containing protein [Anaeromicropila populeti]SFR77922.1 Helix-turn-helix domain-containing protein [Anaeromicropila populeti]
MGMKKFKMLNIICNSCELTSKEKLVAQYFVYKSNRAGACYPSVSTIAEHCGVSERTIQRATKKLEERGLIMIEKRFKFGKQTSNQYTLNILLIEEIEAGKEVLKGESDKVSSIQETGELVASEYTENEDGAWESCTIDLDELLQVEVDLEEARYFMPVEIVEEVVKDESVASIGGEMESAMKQEKLVLVSVTDEKKREERQIEVKQDKKLSTVESKADWKRVWSDYKPGIVKRKVISRVRRLKICIRNGIRGMGKLKLCGVMGAGMESATASLYFPP